MGRTHQFCFYVTSTLIGKTGFAPLRKEKEKEVDWGKSVCVYRKNVCEKSREHNGIVTFQGRIDVRECDSSVGLLLERLHRLLKVYSYYMYERKNCKKKKMLISCATSTRQLLVGNEVMSLACVHMSYREKNLLHLRMGTDNTKSSFGTMPITRGSD